MQRLAYKFNYRDKLLIYVNTHKKYVSLYIYILGWSVLGGFLNFFGNLILPSDQKLFHIIKIKTMNFFYPRLISSGAAIENKKSKICLKSDLLYWYPLKSMFENQHWQAKI